MKTIKIIFGFFCFTTFLNAQIYTPSGTIQGSSGNNSVGIGLSSPSSENSLQISRTAGGTYSRGIRVDVTPMNAAPIGLYARVYLSTPVGSYRSYGVAAEVGNATSGWNYAIFGKLLGENNGAAIMGMIPGRGELNVGGMWAGYFRGNVFVEDNVGIGCTNPAVRLAVNGKIKATELEITLAPCSDYVFEKDYNLMNLNDLENYITKNKHLPEVPSAKEFSENGYSVGEMDDILLRKVEELTLYIIKQQKEIEELKSNLR